MLSPIFALVALTAASTVDDRLHALDVRIQDLAEIQSVKNESTVRAMTVRAMDRQAKCTTCLSIMDDVLKAATSQAGCGTIVATTSIKCGALGATLGLLTGPGAVVLSPFFAIASSVRVRDSHIFG